MILPGLCDPTRKGKARGIVVTAFPVLRYPAHGLTIACVSGETFRYRICEAASSVCRFGRITGFAYQRISILIDSDLFANKLVV